jgi:pimeloyl-ACP methyl ester carboxylesterase
VQAGQLDFVAADGVRLVGTFARPDRDGPLPAALLLNGSGPLDRDSNMPEQKLDVALAFAESLAAQGVASLRFDKRGVGESGGEYLTTSFDRETGDAASALHALRVAAGVDPERTTLIGHSVGATVAIRLAARHPWLGGVVLLAGASSSGVEVMRLQSDRIAGSLRGLQRLGAKRFLRSQARIRDALQASEGDTIDLQGGLPARWFREYMAYDPADDLRAVGCPVLAITGRKDLQVDPDDVERMGALVAGEFTGGTPRDLTHLLRAQSGRASVTASGRLLKRPVDADLLETVSSWVAGRS